MAKIVTEDKHYTDIAATIRKHTGTASTYYPDEMAKGVDAVYEKGVENGEAAGEKSEYDRFWDVYQSNGERIMYDNAFAGPGWTNKTFKPKYDIKGTNMYMLFRNSGVLGDLREVLEELGIELDTSAISVSSQYMFNESRFTAVGVIDLSSMYSSTSHTASSSNGMFTNATRLETIDKLILPASRLNLATAFDGCKALKNLTIEGEIRYNFNVQSCPLTHDSLMSIINALKDGLSYTLTIGSTNAAKLSDAEKEIVTQKGWTLA